MNRVLALLLGALLVGCSSPTPKTPTYTIRGHVLLPGDTRAVTLDTAALWELPHVPGEVLLETPPADRLSAQALGLLSKVQRQAVPGTNLALARTPAGQTDAAFAQRLRATGVRAQPNLIYQALSVPNDPGFPGAERPGVVVRGVAYDQDYLTRIRALEGWNRLEALGKPVDGALTAVLDTGVDAGHPELLGRLHPGTDFCSRLVGQSCQGTDTDPDEVTAGDVGHGTSTAGLIVAQTHNGEGLASLTWRGTVLPVKVFGTNGSISGATSASVIAGLRYAQAQGAKVVNLSLGFRGSRGQAAPADPALAAAIADVAAADIVLVAAAGNTPDEGLYYPASDPNVLAVGAVAREDQALAPYSARPLPGQKPLDLVAPGGVSGSSPDDILTLAPRAQGGYTLRAGTSEAAPLVSGTAALLRAAFPQLRASQIRQALKEGATPTAAGALLNVEGAVNRAASLPLPPPYTLKVEAWRSGRAVTSTTFTGTLDPEQAAVPYTLGGLPAGTYELRATLQRAGEILSGSAAATVPGSDGTDAVQDIQTHR
ncbi:S8 family serine peptidase [Deinococcus sp. YIM 77859]|uniref:S8 family peptidase n=1 Tax=Deinococcus sp. YIM 77859 TaxID=1540221 RepID=UPI00068CC571|nr:S8 family serine peptidase [Deinococcus sp. YIM 77859]